MIGNKTSNSNRRLIVPALFGAASLAACGGASEEAPPPMAAAPAPVEAPPAPMPAAGPVAAVPAAETATPAAPPAPALDPPVMIKDVGFMTPESVVHDEKTDLYLVSNINGKPTDVDGNGFISKVTPDGKVAELKWIDGSKKATALDAPKGLVISKGTLYVADITMVRMFDAKTGKAKGKVAVPGATFLNDVATGPDGTIYVTDTGIKIGEKGPEPTGSDAIYKIGKKGVAEKVIADKDQLGHPNGLIADDKGVWAVTFGSGEVYRVGLDGKKEPGQKLPQGALDGIVKLADGSVLISSWTGSAIYKGTPGGNFEVLVKDVKAPADIGYDAKRNTLMIPLFQSDAVQLQKLPGGPAAPEAAAPAAPPTAKGATTPGPAAPAAPAAKGSVAGNAPAAPAKAAGGPAATPAPTAPAAPAAPAPAGAKPPGATPPPAALPAAPATPGPTPKK